MGFVNATISLRSAVELLNKRYKRILGEKNNVKVKYKLEQYLSSYSDWGGIVETEIYYGLNAVITYNKMIGSIVAKSTITRGESSLKEDLLDELQKVYSDEELVVSNVKLPRFSSDDGVNYDKEVDIYFKEKGKRLKKWKEKKW